LLSKGARNTKEINLNLIGWMLKWNISLPMKLIEVEW